MATALVALPCLCLALALVACGREVARDEPSSSSSLLAGTLSKTQSKEDEAGSEVQSGLTPESVWEIEPEAVVDEAAIEQLGEEAFFVAEPIPDDVFSRMDGRSFKDDGELSRDDLSYLRILHKDADGVVKLGEMVCAASIADDLLDIMHELYDADYPIERMVLVDNYYPREASSALDPVGNDADTASMDDNNTSCFNYRLIGGSDTISNHATGHAVDINTLYNPYCVPSTGHVSPQGGSAYADRSVITPYTIEADGVCVRIFKEHGFSWGGDWTNVKDYQHFEKP